ncbi:MAG: ATP-binding protein [Candidatus Woesearchaeota archaeon]
MDTNNKLEMRFDPHTIEHLGIQMYSTLPPVIAELIANSYDAEATEVNIKLFDNGTKKIIVEDNGHGMSFDDINEKFLLIGRNRRVLEKSETSINNIRKVIGRKGIGKLSFFGIASNIKVETTTSYKRTTFELNWNKLKEQGKIDGKYNPKLTEKDTKVDYEKGTNVVLTEISRKSGFSPDNLALTLSKYFLIFDEKDFNVFIYHNNSKALQIENKLRYQNIQEFYTREFPLTEEKQPFDYRFKSHIRGKIISSKDTVPSDMRGIALFSRGKLVNNYTFFDINASSHGYSYITGWLNIDFIEDFDTDVISTNRQSLNWESPNTNELKTYLEKAIQDFYNDQRKKREQEKRNQVEKDSNFNIEEWLKNLPKHEKKLAKKISDSIIKADGIDISKASELLKYTRDSFQYEAFKDLASELDETKFSKPEKIIELFKEWEIIEAKEFYKIAHVRIETIEKFEQHIKEDSREVPEIQKFLRKFPWILDPRIMNFKNEKTYSDLLKDNFKEIKLEDKDRRIDFLCVDFSQSFFIIELKRPSKVIGKNELEQAVEYVSFIENYLGNEFGKNIYCYVIGKKLANTSYVQRIAKAYKRDSLVYYKTYSELLKNAKRYHKEFIEKYEQMVK